MSLFAELMHNHSVIDLHNNYLSVQ